ncbi:MAG: hypothetical protein CL853_08660 [Crocinitomicaceae bacterium]|nr:hypothetical protein [Crocinitomicaceae bacterium]|tara:strand:- start:326 stop:778 length:453 start_codon:yes stop_codon:yes gene_type:complete
MSSKTTNENNFINPIDKDNVTETPNTLAYPHHRGGVPIIPSKQGDIKHKALSAMKEQTNSQLMQIKEQMELLAKQATSIKNRIDISEQIYNAEIRFEPLIAHTYHLYKKNDQDFFLSMISPNDWGKNKCPYTFIAAVKLLSDHTWEIINS